jgi:hypothetical protein
MPSRCAPYIAAVLFRVSGAPTPRGPCATIVLDIVVLLRDRGGQREQLVLALAIGRHLTADRLEHLLVDRGDALAFGQLIGRQRGLFAVRAGFGRLRLRDTPAAFRGGLRLRFSRGRVDLGRGRTLRRAFVRCCRRLLASRRGALLP